MKSSSAFQISQFLMFTQLYQFMTSTLVQNRLNRLNNASFNNSTPVLAEFNKSLLEQQQPYDWEDSIARVVGQVLFDNILIPIMHLVNIVILVCFTCLPITLLRRRCRQTAAGQGHQRSSTQLTPSQSTAFYLLQVLYCLLLVDTLARNAYPSFMTLTYKIYSASLSTTNATRYHLPVKLVNLCQATCKAVRFLDQTLAYSPDLVTCLLLFDQIARRVASARTSDSVYTNNSLLLRQQQTTKTSFSSSSNQPSSSTTTPSTPAVIVNLIPSNVDDGDEREGDTIANGSHDRLVVGKVPKTSVYDHGFTLFGAKITTISLLALHTLLAIHFIWMYEVKNEKCALSVSTTRFFKIYRTFVMKINQFLPTLVCIACFIYTSVKLNRANTASLRQHRSSSATGDSPTSFESSASNQQRSSPSTRPELRLAVGLALCLIVFKLPYTVILIIVKYELYAFKSLPNIYLSQNVTLFWLTLRPICSIALSMYLLKPLRRQVVRMVSTAIAGSSSCQSRLRGKYYVSNGNGSSN